MANTLNGIEDPDHLVLMGKISRTITMMPEEIRDRFINGKNITHLILNTRDKFTSIEYDMVENFLNCKEKRDFNTLYNQIMKYIRKNLSG
jgi:hypothetical protein